MASNQKTASEILHKILLREGMTVVLSLAKEAKSAFAPRKPRGQRLELASRESGDYWS